MFMFSLVTQLYGPTGIGVLYGKSELLEATPPWLGGGKMIHEVRFRASRPQSAPWKLEAGTPNVAGVIGLSAALEGWRVPYQPGRKLESQPGDAGGRCAGKTSGFRPSAARIPACWPLILLAFITAIW
ncbi:aminotransferase class V-fold PLP-dependent enzyme [Shigella flexneri]